jgi:hypothetical protein
METKGKEIDMPAGKGTYGTTRGRPPKPKKGKKKPKKGY